MKKKKISYFEKPFSCSMTHEDGKMEKVICYYKTFVSKQQQKGTIFVLPVKTIRALFESGKTFVYLAQR